MSGGKNQEGRCGGGWWDEEVKESIRPIGINEWHRLLRDHA